MEGRCRGWVAEQYSAAEKESVKCITMQSDVEQSSRRVDAAQSKSAALEYSALHSVSAAALWSRAAEQCTMRTRESRNSSGLLAPGDIFKNHQKQARKP